MVLNAHSRSQTLRAIALTRSLAKHQVHVTIGAGGAFFDRLRDAGATLAQTYTVPLPRLRRAALHDFDGLLNADMVERYARTWLGLIDAVTPDVVIEIGLQPMVWPVSAHRELPVVTFSNVLSEPNAESTIALATRGGRRMREHIERCRSRLGISEQAFRGHARAYVAFADLPEVFPLRAGLRATYVGPFGLALEMGESLPTEVGEKNPIIFAVNGLTPPEPHYFDELLAAYGRSSVSLVFQTGGEWRPRAAPRNLWFRNEVIPSSVLRRAKVAVNYGGPDSVYRALGHGVPVVVIPDNAMLERVGESVSRLGVGTWIPRAAYSRRALVSAVDKILEGSAFQEAARGLAESVRQASSASAAANIVHKHLQACGCWE